MSDGVGVETVWTYSARRWTQSLWMSGALALALASEQMGSHLLQMVELGEAHANRIKLEDEISKGTIYKYLSH